MACRTYMNNLRFLYDLELINSFMIYFESCDLHLTLKSQMAADFLHIYNYNQCAFRNTKHLKAL